MTKKTLKEILPKVAEKYGWEYEGLESGSHTFSKGAPFAGLSLAISKTGYGSARFKSYRWPPRRTTSVRRIEELEDINLYTSSVDEIAETIMPVLTEQKVWEVYRSMIDASREEAQRILRRATRQLAELLADPPRKED